ncbi:MAG: hypothetical protein ACM32E_06745 [Gemmatimonadota bacterium]
MAAIRIRAASGLIPAVGLFLGLLAIGPGLQRGFLLSYDMVAAPRQPFTPAMFGLSGGPARAVPSDAVLAALSRVVPADVAQKLLLLTVFVLACSGTAALLRGEPWFARLAAGVFYTWNPYVAERLIIGQWALLLGYAGLPWALRAVTAGPVASWRGAGRLLIALLPATVGGFAAMTVSALAVLPAAVLGGGGPPWRRLTSGAGALAVLLVCSLPWLIPSLLRPVYADPAGVAAFAPRADTPFGSFGSLVMLSGIWNAQAVPRGYGGGWSALWLALLVAAAGGYAAFGVRQRRWPGLAIAAAVGLVIAALEVTGLGQDFFRALAATWPGFAVLRDGQQLIAPLALAEALGAGLTAAWAARSRLAVRGHRSVRRQRADRPGLAIAVALLLAPVLLLPGLAWGAAGRLRPAWYPPTWLRAAQVIDSSRERGTVLLLPWAAYRNPAWNGRRTLLDPWPRLLARPVIWNDGVRVGMVRLQPDDPRARELNGVLSRSGPLTADLAAAGIRFVVADSGPLASGQIAGARLPGCTVLIVAPGLTVYRVPASR